MPACLPGGGTVEEIHFAFGSVCVCLCLYVEFSLYLGGAVLPGVADAAAFASELWRQAKMEQNL